jgi:hypothetical protein
MSDAQVWKATVRPRDGESVIEVVDYTFHLSKVAALEALGTEIREDGPAIVETGA